MTKSNLTVGVLKRFLEELPDDMQVVMPVIDTDNADKIYCFRHVRTAGVLKCPGSNPEQVFCMNALNTAEDIYGQLKSSGYQTGDTITCERTFYWF